MNNTWRQAKPTKGHQEWEPRWQHCWQQQLWSQFLGHLFFRLENSKSYISVNKAWWGTKIFTFICLNLGWDSCQKLIMFWNFILHTKDPLNWAFNEANVLIENIIPVPPWWAYDDHTCGTMMIIWPVPLWWSSIISRSNSSTIGFPSTTKLIFLFLSRFSIPYNWIHIKT